MYKSNSQWHFCVCIFIFLAFEILHGFIHSYLGPPWTKNDIVFASPELGSFSLFCQTQAARALFTIVRVGHVIPPSQNSRRNIWEMVSSGHLIAPRAGLHIWADFLSKRTFSVQKPLKNYSIVIHALAKGNGKEPEENGVDIFNSHSLIFFLFREAQAQKPFMCASGTNLDLWFKCMVSWGSVVEDWNKVISVIAACKNVQQSWGCSDRISQHLAHHPFRMDEGTVKEKHSLSHDIILEANWERCMTPPPKLC